MSNARSIHAWKFTGALLLASALPGCATFGKGESSSSHDDTSIAGNIRAELTQHPGVEPNAISVQSRNHVVYLYGLVESGLESDAAAVIAHQQPGVGEVVNSIAVSND
jgi:osmotically-inducible protein OsmY